MNWKIWQKPIETRQADGYSDALLLSLLQAADGSSDDTSPTAASETAPSLWSRAFAMAKVQPETPITAALTPRILADIGRDLAETGESVHLIDVRGGQVVLERASSWTVYGDRYQISTPRPENIVTRWVMADSVLHCQYDRSRQQPWRSDGPNSGAGVTATALSRLESRLADELGMPVGALIPTPDVNASGDLQADIRKMRGNISLVESLKAYTGRQEAPGAKEFESKRVGADPPASLTDLRESLANHLLASFGVPSALIAGGDADATSLRESWRLFLFSTVAPIGRMISTEIGYKLDAPGFSFNWDGLMASDISGRARAVQSLVGAGSTLEQALEVTGLLED